jgi:hypothetical protein
LPVAFIDESCAKRGQLRSVEHRSQATVFMVSELHENVLFWAGSDSNSSHNMETLTMSLKDLE